VPITAVQEGQGVPRKRPIDTRLEEARELLERLRDEKKLQELKEKMKKGSSPSRKRRF